jgi:hypothetical protein
LATAKKRTFTRGDNAMSDISDGFEVVAKYYQLSDNANIDEVTEKIIDHLGDTIEGVGCEGDVLSVFRLLVPVLTSDLKTVRDVFSWTCLVGLPKPEQEIDAEAHKLVQSIGNAVEKWPAYSGNKYTHYQNNTFYICGFIGSAETEEEKETLPFIDLAVQMEKRNDSLINALHNEMWKLWELTQFTKIERLVS